MFKSLYFKIILILLIFIMAVMCTVSVIMINNVSSFFAGDFIEQLDVSLAEDTVLYSELEKALGTDDFAKTQKSVLASYSSVLGVDEYRNYYILDMNGVMLEGSDRELGSELKITQNMLSAISGERGNMRPQSNNFADYAVYLSNGDNQCIVYIVDSLDEMQEVNSILVSIIIQGLFCGILIAIILSFCLARAITYPIQNITRDAQLVAQGEFTEEIDVHSDDEIGILADNFNYMKNTLKTTLDKFDGERQKLTTIFTFLKDPIVVFTNDGGVMNFNQSANELIGSSLGDYSLTRLLDDFDLPLELGDSEDNPLVNADGSECLGVGAIFNDRPFAGRVFDVSIGEMKYSTDNVQRVGVIAVFHDVTSRFELDNARREFVANVSHELRTPLTSIKGACETIVEDPEIPRVAEDYFLKMALEETDRMIRIVSDLLVLSRLDDKRTKWSVEKFDMNAVVRHVCDVMKPTTDAHSHKLTYDVGLTELLMEADKGRIEQVIVNIVSNAVKYTPDGGEIKVASVKDGDFVKVSVSDNGIGIPEEDIPHLFERFYRVEKARTSETGGTGLGLAIANEIVEAHGGTISVDSILGKGTTVSVTLPLECRLVID